MSITDNIQTHLDKNELTTGVFIELRKAFDTVDHETLLTKQMRSYLQTMELENCQMIGTAHN